MIFTWIGYMAGYALDTMLTAGIAAALVPVVIVKTVAHKTKTWRNVLEKRWLNT